MNSPTRLLKDGRGTAAPFANIAMTLVLLVTVLIVAAVLFDIVYSGLSIVEEVLRFLPGVQPP
ncbi:MAG: hypothetical protein ACI9PP_002456 [Halobacteriales archaeon]|jgi:hypothetical protein